MLSTTGLVSFGRFGFLTSQEEQDNHKKQKINQVFTKSRSD